MKIVVTTRTRNEENNIEDFCLSNQWADEILIADGGSSDETTHIAHTMPKTQVKYFGERVYSKEMRYWRNPHGKHINFLIDWAFNENKADWMIFDDCDSFPSLRLQENARTMLSEAESGNYNAVGLHHIYIYHKTHYFPDMNKPGTFTWAFKKDTEIRACEKDPWKHKIITDYGKIRKVEYDYPFSVLHYFMNTDEEIKRKLDFYRGSGQHPYMPRFEEFDAVGAYGQMKPLEDWMKHSLIP